METLISPLYLYLHYQADLGPDQPSLLSVSTAVETAVMIWRKLCQAGEIVTC